MKIIEFIAEFGVVIIIFIFLFVDLVITFEDNLNSAFFMVAVSVILSIYFWRRYITRKEKYERNNRY